MPRLGHSCEGFADENATVLKESIQNTFEESASLVGIGHGEKAIEVLADCLKAFLMLLECFRLTTLLFPALACLSFALLAHPSK